MCQIKEWSCDYDEIDDDWSKFEFELTWFMICLPMCEGAV